jgi:glycerol-3-phosphate dehydrogenase (NAD(P)+)
MRAHLAPGQGLVSLTKGIESSSLKTMSEIMEEVFATSPRCPIGVLSGPSFSREVAEQHPTALVLASRELAFFRRIQHKISSLTLRIYTSSDVIGVELAGALKNVIAIASGISDALSFGDNTRAALITRGMAEITRLGMACGAHKETFLGLAGIGDLFLTCTGKLSRNRYVGYELGSGRPLPEILSGLKMVAEGISTTLSARRMARRKRVEMPISEQVYQVLYKNKSPRQALNDLMSRKLRDEF